MSTHPKQNYRRTFTRNRPSRQGSVVVEMALCLPLIMLMIFGTIEACTMIFLKQSLTIASYEGAREALEPGATAAEVESVINQILSDRQIQSGSVRIVPDDFHTREFGQLIQIHVTAPSKDNGIVPVKFFSGHTLTGSTNMFKEY